MILSTINGKLTATAESESDSHALVRAANSIVFAVQVSKQEGSGAQAASMPKKAGKRGKPRKYMTQEEKRLASIRFSRRYYLKNKDKIAERRRAKKLADQGTPVPITKVEESSTTNG